MPAAKKTATESKQNGGDEGATRRIVMQRVRAIVLPVGSPELVAELVEGLTRVATVPKDEIEVCEAFVERGVFTGSKLQAITAYAGEAGTPDAKPGTYFAPTETAWRGDVTYVRPERPKVERKVNL